MNKLLWIVVAFLSGAFLPIQAALNAKMGKEIESPVYASFISFIIGTLAVLTYALVGQHPVVWTGLRNLPAYTWLAGVLGAFYVTAIIFLFPRLGPALTFGLVVAGQMVLSVLLDHFNILVAQPHSLTIWRMMGIILVIMGVVIIRKF